MRFVTEKEGDDFCERIRLRVIAAKREINLSCRNLSKLSGLDKYTITRYINGNGNANLKTVYALCAALGVQLGEIPTEEADADR